MEKYQFAQCQLSVGRRTEMTINRNVRLSIEDYKAYGTLAFYIAAWKHVEDGLALVDSYQS